MLAKKFDWEKSLKAEIKYWLHDKERICSKQWLDHVKKKTAWLLDWYKDYGSLTRDSHILQVGSGAEGEINFLEKGHRFAVDPLADFYKSHFGNIINTEVEFLKGRGESLPFEDNYFDLVITFNSLDHTENPSKTLSEMRRVLKKEGILYVGVHVRSEWGHFMFEQSKKYNQLSDHYYSYTKKLLKKELIKHSFAILDEKDEINLERFAMSRASKIDNDFMYDLKFLVGKNQRMYNILAKKT